MANIARFPRSDGYQDGLRWVRDHCLGPSIRSFTEDPPDPGYQTQFAQALMDVDAHVRAKIVPGEKI